MVFVIVIFLFVLIGIFENVVMSKGMCEFIIVFILEVYVLL